MHYEDPYQEPTTTRHTEIVPLSMHEHDDGHAYHPDPHPAARKISMKMIGRALQRHWWQAGLLWMIGSVGLMVLAYTRVKPTFQAFSRVRVEPGEHALFAQASNNIDFAQYQESQVATVTSPPVIQAALSAHQDLLQTPRLVQAEDPEEEIRRSLNVSIVPKTNFIEVSMTSESASEAVAIVNAVVEAYLKNSSANIDNQTDKQLVRLRDARKDKLGELEQKRNALQQLQLKMRSVTTAETKDRSTMTSEDYRMLSTQLLQLEIDLMEAENRLYQLQNDQSSPVVSDDPLQQERELQDLFYAHPAAAEIKAKLDRERERLANAERLVRDRSDPSRATPQKKVRELDAQLKNLYTQLKPTLATQSRSRGGEAPDRGLREAELKVSGYKAKQASLTEKLEKLTIRQRTEGSEAIQLEFVREDLHRAEELFGMIERQLNQTEFEAKNPIGRITKEFDASNRPNANNRLRPK